MFSGYSWVRCINLLVFHGTDDVVLPSSWNLLSEAMSMMINLGIQFSTNSISDLVLRGPTFPKLKHFVTISFISSKLYRFLDIYASILAIYIGQDRKKKGKQRFEASCRSLFFLTYNLLLARDPLRRTSCLGDLFLSLPYLDL